MLLWFYWFAGFHVLWSIHLKDFYFGCYIEWANPCYNYHFLGAIPICERIHIDWIERNEFAWKQLVWKVFHQVSLCSCIFAGSQCSFPCLYTSIGETATGYSNIQWFNWCRDKKRWSFCKSMGTVKESICCFCSWG